ncbi:MAG TPA: flagellar biosynthesis protein FlhB [Clostridiales bacterium]|nr:flagellar biosynthesis protein FlhB [Clostridiales bacterium]
MPNFSIRIQLQLFTGEKTEKATPKRRKEAREKGQVRQSREINSAFVLLFAFIALKLASSFICNNLKIFTERIFTEMTNLDILFTVKGIHHLLVLMTMVAGKMVVPILGTVFVVGLVCSYAQVGFLFTTKTLAFKPSKLNPINGFKRIFSKRSLVELVKSLIKVGIVGYVTISYLLKQSKNITNVFDMELAQIAVYLANTTSNLVFRAAIVLILIAALDFFYQHWEYEKELRMSKQEIKEEYKQMEGDPQVKSKIKEKQRQISMRRMMQDVPKADVIITNPTHYAVALRYDSKIEDAPVVLAKGKDLIAQKIKELALEHEIMIVENKGLARTLYYTVEVGAQIPPELYQAVAEVLAYVYQMKNIH